MDVKRLRVVDGLMVALGRQHRPHLRGVPRLEAGAELFGQCARSLGEACALVGARDRELGRAHADIGPVEFVDGRPHDRDAALRLGVELARVILSQFVDQRARPGGKARADEAAIAAGRAPAHARALDQHDLEAAHRQQPRAVQTGKPAAHDCDIGLGLARKRRAVRTRISRGGIPACRIVGVGHSAFFSAISGDTGRLARSPPLSH